MNKDRRSLRCKINQAYTVTRMEGCSFIFFYAKENYSFYSFPCLHRLFVIMINSKFNCLKQSRETLLSNLRYPLISYEGIMYPADMNPDTAIGRYLFPDVSTSKSKIENGILNWVLEQKRKLDWRFRANYLQIRLGQTSLCVLVSW